METHSLVGQIHLSPEAAAHIRASMEPSPSGPASVPSPPSPERTNPPAYYADFVIEPRGQVDIKSKGQGASDGRTWADVWVSVRKEKDGRP